MQTLWPTDQLTLGTRLQLVTGKGKNHGQKNPGPRNAKQHTIKFNLRSQINTVLRIPNTLSGITKFRRTTSLSTCYGHMAHAALHDTISLQPSAVTKSVRYHGPIRRLIGVRSPTHFSFRARFLRYNPPTIPRERIRNDHEADPHARTLQQRLITPGTRLDYLVLFVLAALPIGLSLAFGFFHTVQSQPFPFPDATHPDHFTCSGYWGRPNWTSLVVTLSSHCLSYAAQPAAIQAHLRAQRHEPVSPTLLRTKIARLNLCLQKCFRWTQPVGRPGHRHRNPLDRYARHRIVLLESQICAVPYHSASR